MKRAILLLFIMASVLASCSTSAVKENTMDLRLGMDKAQALRVMQKIPCMTEAYTAGSSQVESWIYSGGFPYACGATGNFVRLSFRDGRLVEWGKKY